MLQKKSNSKGYCAVTTHPLTLKQHGKSPTFLAAKMDTSRETKILHKHYR